MQIAKSKRLRPAKGPRRCRVRNRILARTWTTSRSGKVNRQAVAAFNDQQRINVTVEEVRDENGKSQPHVKRVWRKHPAQ